MPALIPLDGSDWTLYWLLPKEWEWRRVWEREPPEATARRLPARVPGHAQEALLQAGCLPSPYQGLNSRLWEWTSERDWIYEKRFHVPPLLPGEHARLCFEGIDEAAHVFVNGQPVGAHRGQLAPAQWDVTALLRQGRENHLLVVVEHAPAAQGQIGHTSRERRLGARFARGWDWCTRLIPVGLWDTVALKVSGSAWFQNVAVHTNLSSDREEAAVSVVSEFQARRQVAVMVVAEVTLDGLPVARVEDPITLFRSDTSLVQSLVIPRVQLWWPNGDGPQPLYRLRMALVGDDGSVVDRYEDWFGVRHVEAVPCDGAPPDALPYLLEVNGRRTWIRGWNWVPLDHLYGAAGMERYDRFLRLARDAHVNLLRVWGGGLLEREGFYRLCDRYGLMVWQEFPLSGSGLDNEPPGDAEFVRSCGQEAARIVPRRRNHPSLVLWCGGNELTDREGRPLGSDHPALAELRETVAADDPRRLWLPTSPTGPVFDASPRHRGQMHDVHGPWEWLGLTEHPAFHDGLDMLLYSEFGCEGAADAETLACIFAGEAPAPSPADPVWQHHGGAWWLRPERVRAAFGEWEGVEQWRRASARLQALGLQYAVEAARRRQWRCAGTLPWQFNEAFPNAVCTSAVDYFGRPKPAYFAVRRAYSNLHVSARLPAFAVAGRPELRAELWVHNGGPARPLLNVVVRVVDLEGREHYQESVAAEAPENGSAAVGDVAWRIPRGFARAFLLRLELVDEEGEELARNEYWLSCAPPPEFAAFQQAARTVLQAEQVAPGLLAIRNAGAAPALGVRAVGAQFCADGDFSLLPGEERELSFRGDSATRLVAWNAEPVLIEPGQR